MRARAGIAIAATAIATAVASPAALAQQNSDWSITVGNAAWSGGTAWTGPEGAQVSFTRPSWAGVALHSLRRGTATVASTGWYSPGSPHGLAWTGLAEAAYTLSVSIRTVPRCTNGGRMCSYATSTNTASFAVDTSPPGTPQVITPDGPARSTDPVRWWPVDDARSGLARYEVLLDGQEVAELGAGECASECRVQLPATSLPDGARDIQVRAVDLVGNTAHSAAPARLVADVPEVEFHEPPAFVIRGRRAVIAASAAVANGGPLEFAWDLDGDGRFETDTGAEPRASLRAEHDATVRVRATAPGGGQATAEMPLDVRPAALADAPGVSIEDGARFTRDPRVRLSIAWPDGATAMRIATDGGFRGAEWRPVADESTITLAAEADSRLPHVVYVRFRGAGIDARETYTDDILLDTTAPVLAQASARSLARGTRITSRATDALSGLAELQVAAGPGRPVITVPYARKATVRVAPRRPLVRVVDRAGNASRWVRARARIS